MIPLPWHRTPADRLAATLEARLAERRAARPFQQRAARARKEAKLRQQMLTDPLLRGRAR
jgi:hypothetical protein